MHLLTSARGMVSVVAALAVLGGACSRGHELPEVVAITIEPGDTITLPADSVSYSENDLVTIHNARDALLRSCMMRAGFDYPVIVRQPGAMRGNSRRYGISDPVLAADQGFRAPSVDLVDSDTASRVADFYANLPEAGGLALMGHETAERTYAPNSCFGQAQAALGIDDLDASQIWLDELLGSARRAYEADPRLADANADWAECMAGLGYDYADPLEAVDDRRWSGIVTATERQVATADIRCKETTDYLGRAASIESAYQERVIEAHQAELAQIEIEIEIARKLAIEVLAAT